MNLRHTAKVLSVSIILVASIAHAGEGVLEINQDCALNGGCFAGDNAGFPVTISNAGSYMLTGDLDVTVASDPPNTTAISVSANRVAIDLNGFTISGPVTCSGTPVSSCANTGFGRGIDGSTQTVVTNGFVRGMGADGINLLKSGTIRSVGVFESGDVGIFVSDHAQVEDVLVRRNNDDGISMFANAMVKDVRAVGNGNEGISGQGGGLVQDSTARNNGSDGIEVEERGSVIDNAVHNNSAVGISCFDGGALRGNVVEGNNSGGNQVDAGCTLVADNLCNGASC